MNWTVDLMKIISANEPSRLFVCFYETALEIFTQEGRGLLITACTQPNVICSVYMEALALHKASLCPPELSQAVRHHAEGGTCLSHWPALWDREKQLWLNPLPHPNSRAMTEQLIDNRNPVGLWILRMISRKIAVHCHLVSICREWKKPKETNAMFHPWGVFFLPWHVT